MSAAPVEPVSPAAVVTVALFRALGVRSASEARALLREAVIWQVPRMSGANVAEILASFDGGPAEPEQRHTETWEPGEVTRDGARFGGVDETGQLHDGPEGIE